MWHIILVLVIKMIFERIRELREEKNWTQQHLAQLLFINRRTYSSYETGVRTIAPDIFIKLAEIYGVSVDYILGRTDVRQPYSRKK